MVDFFSIWEFLQKMSKQFGRSFREMWRDTTHFKLGDVSLQVGEGIVLRHKISNAGLEVNLTKTYLVSKLPMCSNVKPLRSFLEHAEFYKRFIEGFFQIAKPLSNLSCTDQPYNFNEKWNQVFQTLKDALILASILIRSDWSQPFELMSDASDVVVCWVKERTKWFTLSTMRARPSIRLKRIILL